MNVQIIEKNGKPEWAVIPYAEYCKLHESLEDAEDISDINKSAQDISAGKKNSIPGEITFAILEGKSPMRVWREYRKIKMADLAKKVGISPAYLSQIENGKRNPTIDTMKSIAKELGVEIEMVI